MKLVLVSIVLCAAICVASAMKLLASSSRELNRRETNLVKRLVKRQALNDPNCNPRACAVPNCGKDYVAATLQGECCERCIPWEYARSLGIAYPLGPPSIQDPRGQQRGSDPYNPYQPNRVNLYIYGPDEGARVSAGQSIYFDCELNAPYNQYAQPRWTRAGNQPLPQKVQSKTLPGNRKIARLTIPDATYNDAGRYECNGGTGSANDQTSIDLQVTEGGYYPRPQPQPQPQYPNYDPYNPPGYYPSQPQPQPQPQPHHHSHHHQHPQPQPAGDEDEGDEGEDIGDDEDQEEPAAETTTAAAKKTTTPASADKGEPAEGGEDGGEYPEDYSENEK